VAFEPLLLAQMAFLTNRPIFAMYQTVSVSAAANTWTAMPMQTVVIDGWGSYSAQNATRYTAVDSGWYKPRGTICWSNAQTSGFRSAMVAVNGARVPGSAQDVPASPDYTTVASKPVLVWLNSGDFVELVGYTNVATSTAVTVPDLRTRLDVTWEHR